MTNIVWQINICEYNWILIDESGFHKYRMTKKIFVNVGERYEDKFNHNFKDFEKHFTSWYSKPYKYFNPRRLFPILDVMGVDSFTYLRLQTRFHNAQVILIIFSQGRSILTLSVYSYIAVILLYLSSLSIVFPMSIYV